MIEQLRQQSDAFIQYPSRTWMERLAGPKLKHVAGNLVATFTPEANHQGHNGILHGGVIADLIKLGEIEFLNAQKINVDKRYTMQRIDYRAAGAIGKPVSCSTEAILSDSGDVRIKTTVQQKDETTQEIIEVATSTTAYSVKIPESAFVPNNPPPTERTERIDIRTFAEQEAGYEALMNHIKSATGTYGNYRLQENSFQYDRERKSLALWYPLSRLPDRATERHEGVINFMIDLASGALGQIVAGPGNIAITANHTIYRSLSDVKPDKDIIFTTRHVESNPPTKRGILIETEAWQDGECIAHAVTTLSRVRAPRGNRGEKGGESLPTE